MNKETITFSATQQTLIKTGGIDCFAAETVKYVEAQFDLGENWSGFDHIDAIWTNDGNFTQVAKTLDPQGVCIVPVEVLSSIGDVRVNLVGTTSEDDEVTERLTTYPIFALGVNANVPLNGSETQPITQSQFDQFVAIVIAEVEKVTGMTAEAVTLPPGSDATAEYRNGKLILGIPQGIQGDKGDTGETGNGIDHVLFNSDYSLSIVFTNGEIFKTPPIRGERGPQGIPGEAGATPDIQIGSVETLPAGSPAEVTITGTPEEPELNFKIPKGDTGEVTLEDLSLLLPTDTASGDIISIPDGQPVIPVKSLKVQLDPIQDLHGYDSPWTAGAGKNKLNELRESYGGTETSRYYTDLSSANGDFNRIELKAGQTYTMSYDLICDNLPCNISAGCGNGNYTQDIASKGVTANGRVSLTFTPTEAQLAGGAYFAMCPVRYNTAKNYTWSISNIQLELGSAASAYAPYENICPISGHTEVETEVCGANIWGGLKMAEDISNALNIPYDSETKTIRITTGIYQDDDAHVLSPNVEFKENTRYTLITSGTSGTLLNLMFRYTDGTTDRSMGRAPTIGAYVSKEGKTIEAVVYRSYSGNTILNYEECGIFEGVLTADQFEPYQGTSYTTDLGRTVYGGTLDVVSGELVVDRAYKVFDGSSDEVWSKYGTGARFTVNVPDYTSPISSTIDAKIVANYLQTIAKSGQGVATGVISGGDTGYHQIMVNVGIKTIEEMRAYLAEHPLQVVYPLTTPQTHQLDPQQVMLLHGNNNVWSDGSVELTYNADVGLYIDKKLGTSGTRSLTSVRPTLSVSQDPAEDDPEDTPEEEIK